MPTVEQAFQCWLTGIEVPGVRVTVASKRWDRLKDLFDKKEVKVNGAFWGGSYRRGTCVNRIYNLKVYLVLNSKYFYDAQKSSTRMLNFLRSKLNGEYPGALIGRGGQVVTVKFDDPPDLELVPSVKLASGDYLVPNGIGGWYKTNPGKEEAIFSSKEEGSGGRFISLVKIIKVWNEQAGLSFNPYYLELVVFYRVSDFDKTYSELVTSVFKSMLRFLPEFMSCPAVGEVVSLGELTQVRPKVKKAHDVSSRALNERKVEEAVFLWKSLLGERFGGADTGTE